MPMITFLPHIIICPKKTTVLAKTGELILDVALRNNIFIEHACEKSCSCTTCHCIIRKGFNSLKKSTEIEEDMLDKAWGLESESRLSCQTTIETEDLVIEIPRYTINHFI